MAIRYELTEASRGRGDKCAAVFVSWEDVEDYLGHPHEGNARDDSALVEGLLMAGAPDWVVTADGWIDETGWGLFADGKMPIAR